MLTVITLGIPHGQEWEVSWSPLWHPELLLLIILYSIILYSRFGGGACMPPLWWSSTHRKMFAFFCLTHVWTVTWLVGSLNWHNNQLIHWTTLTDPLRWYSHLSRPKPPSGSLYGAKQSSLQQLSTVTPSIFSWSLRVHCPSPSSVVGVHWFVTDSQNDTQL